LNYAERRGRRRGREGVKEGGKEGVKEGGSWKRRIWWHRHLLTQHGREFGLCGRGKEGCWVAKFICSLVATQKFYKF